MNQNKMYDKKITNETKEKEVDVTHQKKNYSKKFSTLKEIVSFVLLALIIVVPIRVYIAQPYVVSGNSMHPTFESGDYLIVDQISYRKGLPGRGDVTIFRFPLGPSKFFIKRVIGLPNETVVIENNVVTIINEENPKGFILEEKYLTTEDTNTILTFKLSDGEYFVMGDNRKESLDSRAWGAVQEDLFIGRAYLRLLPITKIDYLPGLSE